MGNCLSRKRLLVQVNYWEVRRFRTKDEEGLLKAAADGNLEELRRYLKNGVNPNIQNTGYADTPLYLAVSNNAPEMVRMLLDHKHINSNVKHRYNDTPLHRAVYLNYAAVVKMLLDHKHIEVNEQDHIALTPLHIAVRDNYQDIVRMLINHQNIDINVKDDHGRTPLMLAAADERSSDILNMLLRHSRIDREAQDNDGDTALLIASEHQTLYGIQLLTNHNCNLNHCNRNKDSILLKAAIKQPVKVLQFLLAKNADINYSNTNGDTAAMIAIRNNTVEVFQFLLESNAAITADQCNETTALHKVTQHGSVDLLMKLLSLGASVNHLNSDGQIALHRACQSCDSHMVQVLLDHESLVDVQDKDGFTPLHVAAKYNAAGCARIILKCIKSEDEIIKLYNTTDQHSRTPLTCSFYYGSEHVSYIFTEHLKQISLHTFKEAISYRVRSELLNCLDTLYDQNKFNLDKLVDIYSFPVPVHDVHTVDAQGQSILHYVCEYGIKSHVQHLLKKGADINLKDKNGVAPVDIARKRRTLKDVFSLPHQDRSENVKICIATHHVLTIKGVGAAAVINEIEDIINGVTEIMVKLNDLFPEELRFTPQLSGSVSEDTKSGEPDEFDFMCTLNIKGVDSRYTEVFQCLGLNENQTGTKRNFVCIRCPSRYEQYKGEEREIGRTVYTCLDYVKLCKDFIKYLTAAVHKLIFERLPSNLYIYRQVQVINLIPTLHLKWRGQELRDLNIKVDIVPTLKLNNVSHIKDMLGVKHAGDVFAVAKSSGFDDMKYHMRLTFSDIETKLISSYPLYCKLAYILLKSLRHPTIYQAQTRTDGVGIKIEDDLPSYTIKTCLMFVLEDDGLENQENNGTREDKTAIAAYIQKYHSQIISVAAKVIHRIKDYLINFGGVPSFFNRTYDILFGYSLSGNYNLRKLNVNGPCKERKERILRFCNFVEESLKSGHLFIQRSMDDAEHEEVLSIHL